MFTKIIISVVSFLDICLEKTYTMVMSLTDMQTRDLFADNSILDVAVAIDWYCPFCGKQNTSIMTCVHDERECKFCCNKVNLKVSVEVEI